ncbi:MAG: HAMP domain-containing histidine kinase [Lachnospiraceae bacterium]|nr:HAMP domain-containing histidine kinase [Lachnospiraceae bacterium]
MKQFFTRVKDMVRMRSLRARLFFIILIVGGVPCLLSRAAIVSNYEARAVERRISVLQTQMRIVSNHLISNDYMNEIQSGSRTSNEVIDAELEMLSNIYEGRVMIVGGNFKVVKDTFGIHQGKTMISQEVIRCFRGESTAYYDEDNGYIELTVPIVDTTDSAAVPQGVLLTSVSNESITSMTAVLNRNAWIMATLILLVVTVLAIALSYFLVRPLDRVTRAIREVRAGYSADPISVPDYAETVHIVDAFNELLSKMSVVDRSREEFVANVSHELKTPMTSIKVLSDTLLSTPDAPIELYRDFLQDIASEVDRENRVITDLLALVKMDEKAATDVHPSSVNINELTELILKRLRPIARKKDVELIFESEREVVAEVDEVKMTLLLSNLVENAIKYNQDHGTVRVILDADHRNFFVDVIDTGIGIPEDSLPFIYDRFYRVDKSHSREIGGTGLGLAICRSVVLMHRGSISVRSTEGEGSTFRVEIPLNFIQGKEL